MSEIQDLERAIAALESQRSLLGDSTVDTALVPLRATLQALKDRQKTHELQLKYVSVLFTDIVGSTRLGQHLDPEDTMEIMNSALERFDQVIQQHGGRVTRFMGDGLLAVFGIPSSSEDDPERAVRAGLALVQVAGDYARRIEETWQLSGFNVRVGINTGQVLVGSGVEEENTTMGMAVNLAARMESAAPIGGVLISENTYQHVRGKFELLAQQPIVVKGLDQPVQTYHVLRASPRPFHAAGRGIDGVSTALVGREPELAWLKATFREHLQKGRAGLVTVLGEAGVGKSSLLMEFEAWMAQQPGELNSYKGRAAPQTRRAPYSLLRELLAEAFNILESDPAERARASLESGLRRYLEEEAQMKAHFIGAMLGFDNSSSHQLSGVLNNPKEINQRGQFYLRQYFEKAATAAPTLVLLEDIHWADQLSLDFLQQLVGSLEGFPLLVICLARRLLLENHPEWLPAGSLRLDLQPLSEEHSRRLVRAILIRVEELPASLQELIVQQAEGNPYYIEELINVLIDDGIILAREGEASWLIDSSRLDDLRIPPTLTAVLQARLDGLPAAERNILQKAAVIGRTFWDQPVQGMLSAPEPPTTELAALAQRGLIQPNNSSTFQGAGEYAFRQTLLREVAYETVLKRDRQRYHASVAAWLTETTQASGRSDEHLALIAEHYERAGDSDQAADWYLRAAERAKSQGAPAQARHFYSRTLELLPESDPDRQWQALLGRDEVLGLLGETAARQADDQVLLALAKVGGDERQLAAAYYRLGYSASNRGDERAALQAYQGALAAARSCKAHQIEAEILALSTISLTRLGELERAGQTAEDALELAQQLNDDETLAKVITNIAAHYSEAGNLSRAQELLQQQIQTTQRLGHRLGEAIGLSNLGYGYAQLGEYVAAQAALEDSLHISQAIGARQYHAFGQLNLGLVHWRAGRCGAAGEVLEQALTSLNAIGDQFGCTAGLVYLALNQETCTEYSSAETNFTQARTSYQDLGMLSLRGDATAGLARCTASLKQMEQAQQYATELWAQLLESGCKGMEFPILAYLTCATVFSALKKPGQAQAAILAGYQELMARANKIGDPQWRDAFLRNLPEHVEIRARFKQVEAR